jgi:hypothetical protein
MTDLAHDQTPWLVIALCVLDRGYDKADTQTLRAVEIGLRSIQHPDCVRATVRVRELMGKKVKG